MQVSEENAAKMQLNGVTQRVLAGLPPGSVSETGQRMTVVIGHPFLGRGGSESKVMWLIEALKRDYDITVLTTGGWDLPELNVYYGTKVQEGEVRLLLAPVFSRFCNNKSAALRGACYQRCAQQVAHEFDLRISAYNMTDWGMPAIHFIADFSWHPLVGKAIEPAQTRFIYRDSFLRKAYLSIASAYAKRSGWDVLREDILIANSNWTATVVGRICGVECTAVVYPCVWTEFPPTVWTDKEESFVMIGRIAPEKEIERAIGILDVVRHRGYPTRLRLCGQIGDDLYGRRIATLCRKHADWIVPEGRVSGRHKTEMLCRSKFGIQTRSAEPFGISVAEMVKAGAIVFAPNDGGQVEILGHGDLLFHSTEDAADKICAVLSSPEKQIVLRSHLAQRSGSYGTESYIRNVRAAVMRDSLTVCD